MRARKSKMFLAAAAALATASPAAGDTVAALVTYTYNYANVPGKILARAEQRARDIFRRAGVETTFVDCPTTHAAIEDFPACRQPADGAGLTLKILPARMTALWSRPGTNFGLTVQYHAAFVFYDRVEQAAERSEMPVPVLLGDVMAHELGHLALGAGSHSGEGIMRENLPMRELRQGAKGTLLLFTGGQAERMRRLFP